MNPCAFNKLHDACHKDVSSVTNSVDLNLFSLNVFVNKHRLIFVDFDGGLEIVTKLFFVCNNLHSAPSKHKRRTDENRIAYFRGGTDTVFDFCYRSSFGLGNIERRKNFFKAVAVFCAFDCLTVGSDNFNAPFHKRLGQVDGGLTAERGNNALRLLKLDNIHDILCCKRFKIELVCSCIIG